MRGEESHLAVVRCRFNRAQTTLRGGDCGDEGGDVDGDDGY